ncbi:hypothetical protein Tco_0418231 [Tanacetum coccineum]
MKQDIAKQAGHDEMLVPTDDRVKIAKSNLRIDPSMTQTEETFQVALDILKNVPFYNVFLISTEVEFQRISLTGFAAALAVLKPERLKVDKARNE